ncbi:MAG: shikimate dehydrogenase [Gemmatimonadota bacterium]|nr:shikimate dehydrogenase [Gemmatimonadota bacterium]
MITSRTRLFALLGRPVGHSLSPAMHNAAFRALGIDAVYLAMDCAGELVAPLMRGIAAAGGGGNITVPHKAAAAEALADPGDITDAVCNTFWQADGVLRGANTDPEGIVQALGVLGVSSGRWLVVGTGGSARGVLAAAATMGARMAVQSRSPANAESLRAVATRLGVGLADAVECDVVINTTPLGLTPGDPVPVSLGELPGVRTVLDLVYARGETALVRTARALGLRAADGRGVLLGQGAAAFRHWFPGVVPPIEVMQAALRDTLD